MEDSYVKEENKIEVCRLCLDLITYGDVYLLDSVAQNILEVVLPQLNLDLSLEPKICETCNNSMLACYDFKSVCDNREIIDIVKIEKSTEVSVELQAKGRKCDFCANDIDEKEEINSCKEFYNESLQGYLPEWIRTRSTNAVSCKNCLGTLENQCTFLSVCLKTEEKIKNYYLAVGTNSHGKIDLNNVLHFLLSNKNDNIDSKASVDKKFSVLNDNSVCTETGRYEFLTIKSEDIEIKNEEISEEECIKTFYIEKGENFDENEALNSSQEDASNEVFGFYKTSCFKACLVPTCINNTLVTSDKIFLTVPIDDRREGWCNAIEIGIGERLHWQETTNYYVCEDHFNLKEDMKNYVYPYKLIGGKICLKAGVVPHVFKCLDSKKKRKNTVLEADNKEPKQPKVSFEEQDFSQNSGLGKRSIGIQVNLDLLGKSSVGTQVDSLIETRTIGIEATADVMNASTSTTQFVISKEKHKLKKRKAYKVRK